jgi:hypothetical protein
MDAFDNRSTEVVILDSDNLVQNFTVYAQQALLGE